MSSRCRAVTLFLFLSACSSSKQADVEPQHPMAAGVDRSQLPPEIQPVLAPDIALAGFWRVIWHWGYQSTTLQIEPKPDGDFTLSFFKSSCVGPDHWQTTARFDNGALELAEGGKLIEPRSWVLYPCRVAGEDCLVPIGALDQLKLGNLFSDDQEHAFRRIVVEEPERFRDRWLEYETKWPGSFVAADSASH